MRKGFDTTFFCQGGTKRVALIDADLLDRGTRFPNLALEKMSGWLNAHGHDVRLICDYSELVPALFGKEYDMVVLSQVFNFTKRPTFVDKLINEGKCMYGGTGFFEVNGPRLPDEVEHHMPDYGLYDEYIQAHEGEKNWDDYKKASVGFTTRGCFRQCPFCVNRTYKSVEAHSPVSEFLDKKRSRIYLWDDNFMGAKSKLFHSVMDQLAETGKRYQFRQGLDIRLMTHEKAKRFAQSKNYSDFIFAYDHIDEPTTKATIRGLQTWREHTDKPTRAYVLVGYESQDLEDVLSMWQRIATLMQFNVVPYIMRHERYKLSPYEQMYTVVARWCNQPSLFKKMSFRQFCETDQKTKKSTGAPMRILQRMEKEHPAIAKSFFNLTFNNGQ